MSAFNAPAVFSEWTFEVPVCLILIFSMFSAAGLCELLCVIAKISIQLHFLEVL